MGLLGVCLEVGGGGEGGRRGVKLPCLKLVKIMLETSNLAHKHTHISCLKNVPFSNKAFLILLTYFAKKSLFFGQNTTFTQSNSVRVALEIF